MTDNDRGPGSMQLVLLPRPLKELRQQLLLTQAQLAQLAGVAPRSIQAWEKGTYPAARNQRRKVMAALGLPFELHEQVFGPPGR